MIIARFFVKGSEISLDLPIQPGASLAQLMAAVRTDGFVIADSFYIPYPEIRLVVTYEAEQQPARVFHIVPNPEKPL